MSQYNVRMLVTAQHISFNELMKVKLLTEKTLIKAFGKENVHCTGFFKSVEYENSGLYIYINVPKEQQTLLSERTPLQSEAIRKNADTR